MIFIRRGGSNIKNTSAPQVVATMTVEQLDAELKKGYDSIKAGRVYSADEVDELLAKEFDIKLTTTKRRPHAPNNCFD
ncbi:hypothetical protein [Lachnoanaerobaculum gingivalis]|uniref:hypothetical protein n=1 Tax=Lachnoanaerobaculum gingivalis TaxID=2490855 RepID=UPI0024A7509D|nr:hypothetical protein [Lachnoanaerobaculum gingivalis]WHE88317.1 hypothetical protein QJR73_04765 [Lachnoanaerobaculum gingivalis]